MKIDTLEFKNFNSYGEDKQRIKFSDQADFYQVSGGNGMGKTTIANAIIFGLYGKLDGVKLADLPNRINKHLWVYISLWCGQSFVEIERGIEPNKFEAKINNQPVDKSTKKSVQDYLEEEIYGIPYRVFKNVIILSINDFKSFLSMSNADKKQIIDKMFGFSILNDMEAEVKDRHKSIKQQLDNYTSELNQIKESIDSTKDQLNNLKSEANEKNKKRIEELNQSLAEFEQTRSQLEQSLNKQSETLNQYKNDYSNKNDQIKNINNDIKNLDQKINLYEKGVCPTCETPLNSEWHHQQKARLEEKLTEKQRELDEVTTHTNQIKTQLDQVSEGVEEIQNKLQHNRSEINRIKDKITEIKNTSNNTDEVNHLQTLIDSFEDKLKHKSKEQENLMSDEYYTSVLQDLLGENGIKNLAVKTILPGLNANVAAMAKTMHLPFDIHFNEKFDCIIHHLGEQINPMTLSTGERKKADFIIIIAIIKVLKLRFPQLNLLFLDELFSSVDNDGIHNSIKILRQVIKEQNLNCFVISHTPLPHELFDKQLSIYRENGFSNFEIHNME